MKQSTYLKLFFSLNLLVFGGLASLLRAATQTDPVGYATLRIAGTGGELNRAETYLATPMLGGAVESGTIAHIDGSTLHLKLSEQSKKANRATPLARNSYAGTHYLQIVKGPRAGYHAELAGGGSEFLQTTQDLSSLLQAGDAYIVRPYATLTRILGTNNQYARLQTAATFAEADQIFIPDPQSGQLAAYFFREQTDAAPALAHREGRIVETEPILYPGSGFMIRRIAKEDTALISTGHVQSHAAIIPVEKGINFIASTFPVETTLAEFFEIDAGALAEGDYVALPREYGGQDQYAITRTAEGLRWHPHGDAPSADRAKIPVGSVLILYRQGEAFNLHLKRPFDLE